MAAMKTLICALFLVSCAVGALGLGFKCQSEGKKCQALVAFKTPSRMNLSAIASLFELGDYRALLGANAWELSVPNNREVPQGYTLKVPIACSCDNKTGTSKANLTYTVQPDNYLSMIAEEIFGGLLQYQEIVKVNAISDPNKIFPGQKLKIPLPCSCGANASSPVVHYAYVVQPKNTLEGIASEFGSTEKELMSLNGISNSSMLLAGQVLDVPLKACSSNISKYASDSNLLVANGSYAITASHCLQCSCGPMDLELYCAPAPLDSSCSSMQCKNSDLTVGNVTAQPTSAGCNVTACSYSGYVNGTIVTSLSKSLQPRCPGTHVLPTLTRPPSTLEAPSPSVLSPNKSPTKSPTKSPSAQTSGATGVSPANGPSGQASMAPDLHTWFSLTSMLMLGLPFLIRCGDW